MLDSPLIDDLIDLAFKEDLPGGDITSELTVSVDHKSNAVFLAKEDLLVCGLPIIEKIIKHLHYDLKFEECISDGAYAKRGDVIAKLSGSTRQILAMERTALNFLQHLSGVATLTKKITEKAKNMKKELIRELVESGRVRSFSGTAAIKD